jgi:hypothetical protein
MLGSKCQLIPFLKQPGVESCSEEETDGVCHKLLICIGVVTKEGHLGAFFDAAEEELRSVGSQVEAAGHCVVGLEDSGVGWP